MKKLTLSVDPKVIKQAKAMAAKRGTSVSSMFERFVRMQADQRKRELPADSIARKDSGIISWPKNKTDREVLTDALLEKY